MSLDDAWNDVRLFHEQFQVPHPSAPTKLTAETVARRCRWIRCEVDEVEHASTLEQQAAELIDVVYFALGTLVEMGVQPEGVWRAIHAANMRKLWPDGKPRRRADSKIEKPPGWVGPDEEIHEEILRQVNTGLTEMICR